MFVRLIYHKIDRWLNIISFFLLALLLESLIHQIPFWKRSLNENLDSFDKFRQQTDKIHPFLPWFRCHRHKYLTINKSDNCLICCYKWLFAWKWSLYKFYRHMKSCRASVFLNICKIRIIQEYRHSNLTHATQRNWRITTDKQGWCDC